MSLPHNRAPPPPLKVPYQKSARVAGFQSGGAGYGEVRGPSKTHEECWLPFRAGLYGAQRRYRTAKRRRATTRLTFTGNCNHDTFLSACAEHPGEWYHRFYFDNGYEVRGSYDIGRDIDDYGFPDDMSGWRVLDVGCGSGWFSFFFEQRGATVTATDTRGYADFDVYGPSDYLTQGSARSPDVHDERGNPLYFSPVSQSMWIMRELLGSSVVYRNVRIYDLSPDHFGGQTFDLAFVGAVLPHLRDPIGALAAVRSVCHGEVVATTPLAPGRWKSKTPVMILPWRGIDSISWWQPNRACYYAWFEAAGFRDIDTTQNVQLTADLPRPSSDGRDNNPTHTLAIGRAQASPGKSRPTSTSQVTRAGRPR